MIMLQGVHKRYGSKVALEGLNLQVGSGSVLGYIGPNGAGKTTTVKILTATLRPEEGSVRVCDFDALKHPMEVRRRVGYVPESGALYESMTPIEYGTFVGRLQGIAERTLARRLDAALFHFGLAAHRHDRMATFSKGMRQKVLIASALLHHPPLLILDEPLSGLDANAALLLKEIIARLAASGRTVFYCSHLLDVVEKVCDRVVILNEGRILADGSPGEIRAASGTPSIESAFSLLTATTDFGRAAAELVQALEEA